MKKLITVFCLVALAILMQGCAGACQRIKSNGSLIGTQNGDWIVIKQSGGQITDVYRLEDVMVQDEQGSDGWLFLDQNGNPVHIGGDMKAIRVTSNKEEIFNSYIEYHIEFESVPYQEKYNKQKGEH